MKNYLSINKSVIAYTGLLLGSFALLYYRIFIKLIQDWEVDPNYSHGYFIPVLAIYMIWSKRQEIMDIRVDPSLFWGLLVLMAGLLQLMVAWVGSEYFLQGTSMILVLVGISLIFWGPGVTRKLLVPIAYLIFMIPLPAIIWDQLAFPLALMASKIAAFSVDAMGLSILREGNILYLPNVTLQVEEACSGLRSLTTLFALSALVAYLCHLRVSFKWILFLAAVPIALAGNALRLIATAILARHFGSGMAEGFIHELSGWVLFVFGLIILVLLHNLMAKWEPKKV